VCVKLTPGNADDRSVIEQMTQNMTRLFFGDKGDMPAKSFFLNFIKKRD